MLKDTHWGEESACPQNRIYNLFNDTEFSYSHNLLFKHFLLTGFDVTLLVVLDVPCDEGQSYLSFFAQALLKLGY